MSTQQQRLTLTAAAALVPLLAACGSETTGGSGSVGVGERVTGVHWKVADVTVGGTTHEAPAGATVRIDDSGRAQGSYGCNHFSARADFDGDRLRFSDTAATEMACEGQSTAVETTLARTLADGTLTAAVEDGRLTLTTDDGDTVRLTEEPAAPLHGTRWKVTALGAADGAAESLPGGAEPHLTFDKNGKVGGSLGCNTVNASATVRDGRVTLGAPSTTRKLCAAPLMSTERRLLSLFDSTVAYRLDHRTLTLTGADGGTVTAVAADPEP
ncbi:META domain-containing protein [Streptomyces sp. NPDC059894]|uniref:META domain-containing protein n=1 Tax=unclassified Streptomyces TaxID=2593676 RepID=UPI00365D290C